MKLQWSPQSFIFRELDPRIRHGVNLVHRAIEDALSLRPKLLIPCIGVWVTRSQCREVFMHPTCVRCIGRAGPYTYTNF